MKTVEKSRRAFVEEELSDRGIIPVVELDDLEAAAPLLDALTRAALPIAEVTLRTDVALEAIASLRQSHPDALIGAGTVKSADQAEQALAAGAQFIVSPGTDREVIELCIRKEVAVLPGACTPTEVGAALRAGASLIKFFPAEAMGGLRVLQALAGPFREVRFVPTGGINQENLARYLRLPQVAACGGSWMVAPALVREHRFETVEELTREALAIVEEVRRDD